MHITIKQDFLDKVKQEQKKKFSALDWIKITTHISTYLQQRNGCQNDKNEDDQA